MVHASESIKQVMAVGGTHGTATTELAKKYEQKLGIPSSSPRRIATMAKKADLCECSGWRSIVDCQRCPEYNTCDLCHRRVCQYVAVNVYHHNSTEPDELICRPCAKEEGWSKREIATQAVNPETYEYGAACFEKVEE